MARVLLLSEQEARTLLFCAASGGHEVFVAGRGERNRSLRHHRMCREFVALENDLEFENASEDLAEEIATAARKFDVDVIVPTSYDCVRIASRFRARLEKEAALIPTADLETIAMLDDKHRFHQFCLEHDISHPRSVLMTRAEGAADLVAKAGVPYPVMVKPVLGAGGSGLAVVEDAAALERHLESLTGERVGDLPALAQEYFDGTDIDFNGFAREGRVVVSSVMRTSFYAGDGLEEGDKVDLTDFVHHEGIDELGRRIVASSGYSGPLNIDMRIRDSDGRIELIEVNPRWWARTVCSLIEGVNYVDAAIRSTLEDDYEASSRVGRQQWISSFVPVIKGALFGRDPDCWRTLSNTSPVQLRFMAQDRANAAWATLRNW
ncbi:MAG: ATP-grasp domain-containing protein [bacterium]|nr:ATP-grasp domain-containing protein [bacterium]